MPPPVPTEPALLAAPACTDLNPVTTWSSAVHLGLRELRRQPGRFVPLVLAVTLLSALVLAFSGIGTSHVGDLNGAVANSSAELLVLAEGAEGAIQASRIDQEHVATVAALDGVDDARPIGEARVGGRIGGDLYDLSLWGAGPDGPGAPTVVDGRAPQDPGEAVVDLADAYLGLTIGSTLRIADTGDELEVVGFTEDRRFASIPTVVVTYEQWEATLDATYPDADEVEPTMIGVRTSTDAGIDDVIARIDATDAPLAAERSAELAGGLPGIAGVRASFATATIVALLAISGVVGLFFLVSLAGRRRSLEVLRAVGASPRALASAMLTQVVVITASSNALAGAVVAVASALLPARVPLSLSVGLWGVVSVVTTIIAVLSVLAAVRRLRSLDPAEALGRRA